MYVCMYVGMYAHVSLHVVQTARECFVTELPIVL
jgi:hypothetical protein